LLHEIPLFDDKMRKINYLRKRNFLVKAANLPKQFGFEVKVKNLHYDEREPILAKHLVKGKSFISKLFFVFNINGCLLEDNQDYHEQNQSICFSNYDHCLESSFNMAGNEFDYYHDSRPAQIIDNLTEYCNQISQNEASQLNNFGQNMV